MVVYGSRCEHTLVVWSAERTRDYSPKDGIDFFDFCFFWISDFPNTSCAGRIRPPHKVLDNKFFVLFVVLVCGCPVDTKVFCESAMCTQCLCCACDVCVGCGICKIPK